jgi:protoporphyrinogen oxidase
VARVTDFQGKRIVVVGAGVAGLTAADQLGRQGAKVTVVERESRPGGLARSFRADGVTFDIGPHRFHTDDELVKDYILDVLGSNHIMIDRSSAVWLYDRYHDWPLTRASLVKLPPSVMARAFGDLFRRPDPVGDSLEAYILSRYGRTLYEIFFRPYTEKFLNYKCGDLHCDWASAGINRAVIDRRLRFDSLFNVAWTTLFPPRIETKFIYPQSSGIDGFIDHLAARVEAQGGRICCDAPVTALTRRGTRFTSVVAGSQRIPCDLVVWTAPLPRLLELGRMKPPTLKFLSEIIYNFTVKAPARLPYQWTYYGGAALSFTRASLPSHFNPANGDTERTGICLEVVCLEGDHLWRNPLSLRRSLEYDLVRVGLVSRREDLRDLSVQTIPDAYPIYVLDYPNQLRQAIDQTNQLNNVALLGRNGTFWYNNMDHSIRQALDLQARLAQGMSPQQWNGLLSESRAL